METDGLLDQVTRVHSLVLRDMDSESVFSCTNDDPKYHTIAEGLSLLSEAAKVYGHNSVGFDVPVLQKLYPGFALKGKHMDTFLTAQMRWAHIRDVDFSLVRKGRLPGNLVGSHSLEAWGYRLGVRKGTYKKDHGPDAFARWNPDMQVYCEDDTATTKALVQRIRAAGVSPESVETEHELAHYLRQQERNGWPFDLDKAIALQALLAGKRSLVEDQLRTMFDPWEVELGLFTPKRDNKKRGYKAGVPVMKTKMVEFNPSSRDHIANRLIKLYGWEPREFTDSGKPEVDERTLKGLDYPPIPVLREYLLLDKRLGQIAEGKQAWFKHHTDQGPEGGKLTGLFHIHGRVKQNHAVTHRASHANPNIAQVPKVGSPYGRECRELFYAGPEGFVEVGSDASGLELRCLAHYMAKYDNGAYVKVLLEGDIHSENQKAAGLATRDMAKTFIYAFLYGAGDEKIGSIVLPGAPPEMQKRAGAALKAKFLKNLPALKYLLDAVKNNAREHGYLKLIDGRRAYIRSEHAALNTLLQGTGAVICKRWIVESNRRLTGLLGPQGWTGKWAALGWIHDEVQIAARHDVAQQVATTLVDSIRHMTSHFSFRCPLDGEYKIGSNWAETH